MKDVRTKRSTSLLYKHNVSWCRNMKKAFLKLMFARAKSTYVHKHMLKYSIIHVWLVWPKSVYFLAFHFTWSLNFSNTGRQLRKSRVMCRPAWDQHTLFTISVLIVVGNIGGIDLIMVKRVKWICAPQPFIVSMIKLDKISNQQAGEGHI